jgi:amino acid transporter
MQGLFAIVGMVAAAVAGYVQAYPGVIPGGDFVVGWTSILVSAASFLLVTFIFIRNMMGVKYLKQEILRRCPKELPVEIVATMGSSRAAAFAKELELLLKERGYAVAVHSGIFQDVNFTGVSCNTELEKSSIKIGHIKF